MSGVVAYRYSLPLVKPLRFGELIIQERDGLLLCSADGIWADAAPLPGVSRESVDDVIDAYVGRTSRSCPSLDFALDCLQIPTRSARVPVNALLAGEPNEILSQAKELADSPFRAVKLKVGRVEDVRDEAALVREVADTLRTGQTLRLDANRAWNLPQALCFISELGETPFEYIEEPLADPSELELFYEKTGRPYALDETVIDLESSGRFKNAAALVVKPTLVGHLRRIQKMSQFGPPLVFSACFESGVGVAAIARLAMQFSPNCCAGLDTYRWLEHDVLNSPLEFQQGELVLSADLVVDRDKVWEL